VQGAEGFQPALAKLVAVLERLGIRFHLTGGIASVAYGEPRLTQDIDVVLDPSRVIEVEEELLAGLVANDFFFDEAMARRAISSRRMIQLLDVEQAIKLDLYVRCLIPGELDRSVETELFPGMIVPVVARTDAALSKLIWIRHGSHRSRRDLRGILAGASAEEASVIHAMAREMGLEPLLRQVIDESDELDL